MMRTKTTGGNVIRACALLPAVTGSLCKAGAGFLYLNGSLKHRGMDEDYLSAPHLGSSQAPTISHMDLVNVLEDPTRSKALFVWVVGPAGTSTAKTTSNSRGANESLSRGVPRPPIRPPPVRAGSRSPALRNATVS
jgi:hypothetical protein